MLDLSAAFDTVDHTILLERLSEDFGITGNVNTWFRSYMSDRSCRVNVNGSLSDIKQLLYGVPQVS